VNKRNVILDGLANIDYQLSRTVVAADSDSVRSVARDILGLTRQYRADIADFSNWPAIASIDVESFHRHSRQVLPRRSTPDPVDVVRAAHHGLSLLPENLGLDKSDLVAMELPGESTQAPRHVAPNPLYKEREREKKESDRESDDSNRGTDKKKE